MLAGGHGVIASDDEPESNVHLVPNVGTCSACGMSMVAHSHISFAVIAGGCARHSDHYLTLD